MCRVMMCEEGETGWFDERGRERGIDSVREGLKCVCVGRGDEMRVM